MVIGVPREIKNDEYRVAIAPNGVQELVRRGHSVIIEKGAGEGSRISDKEFTQAGAQIVDRQKAFVADMVVKVKEPIVEEYTFLREDQILFCYLHLASNISLTQCLMKKRIWGIAYETVQTEDGELPLLTPMSEIAGCLAVQMGARYLERHKGKGKGLLLASISGIQPTKVVIIGAGAVGRNAARVAASVGAHVTVLDKNLKRLRELKYDMNNRIITLAFNNYNLIEVLKEADLIIGAVLVPGRKSPCLVTRQMLKYILPGTVIVDVSVDQGGCVETSHPTSYENPVYEVDGIIHCCVANFPGAVPCTATYALTDATLPYIVEIAEKGSHQAILENPTLAKGVNLVDGKLVHPQLAKDLSLPFYSLEKTLENSAGPIPKKR